MNLEDQAREIVEQARQADHDVRLTVKEYASWQRVHPQTVYSAIREGRRLEGRVERPSSHTIRIVVPRGSIKTLKSA